jgi:hypothetical protein
MLEVKASFNPLSQTLSVDLSFFIYLCSLNASMISPLRHHGKGIAYTMMMPKLFLFLVNFSYLQMVIRSFLTI